MQQRYICDCCYACDPYVYNYPQSGLVDLLQTPIGEDSAPQRLALSVANSTAVVRVLYSTCSNGC